MDRFFEKISFDQFKKDIKDDINLYNNYELPKRKTRSSAGYDFLAIEDFTLAPGEIKKIPTGVKAKMLDDEVLIIVVRSSMGFKYNVRATNQVGVIDSDYYNSQENEGHMWVSLQNHGDKTFSVKAGEGIAQGIFIKYLTCGEEVEKERDGWSSLDEEGRL